MTATEKQLQLQGNVHFNFNHPNNIFHFLKTIIMIKTITALFFTTMIYSCNQTSANTSNTTDKAPVDSLIANWENNWNKHDSAEVRNMFLADAVLVDDNLITENAAEFSEKWIHPNIKVVQHLRSNKLQEWSEGNRAGFTGKYNMDVVIKDSVVAKPEGIYSVNWIKTGKGNWKITSAVIHSVKN